MAEAVSRIISYRYQVLIKSSLFSCYQLLDRRLRKSLKHMYLVHPTFWIKSLVWMARPFVRYLLP